jgi:hypothetical protein
VFRASPATYVVLIGPWFVIALLMMFAGFETSEMWAAVGIPLGVVVVVTVWLLAFKVEVADKRLSYSSLLGRKRTVSIDDIRSVELKASGSTIRERFLPPTSLEIRAESKSGIVEFRINLKVLGRGAGSRIAEAVSRNREPGR